MGNSIIMLVVVIAVLRRHNVPFDVLVDGDNALVFLRGLDASRVMVDFAKDVTAVSGHEVTLEKPVRVLEEVRFGRSAPVFSGGRYRMVRDWRNVLSGALSSHRWLREERFIPEWIRGVAAAELSLALGVPVLQAFALGLQRRWGGPEGVRSHPHTELLYKGAWFATAEEAREVSLESRLSFERAFGLDPETQVLVERLLTEAPRSITGWLRVALPAFDQLYTPPGISETTLDANALEVWLLSQV